jgi:hypothetical protein
VPFFITNRPIEINRCADYPQRKKGRREGKRREEKSFIKGEQHKKDLNLVIDKNRT